MPAKKKVKRRPATKAMKMKKPARAKYPTRKDCKKLQEIFLQQLGGNFEKSTWQGSDQSYSPPGGSPHGVFTDGDKTPEQGEADSGEEEVDEVGDKVLYSKREILEDLKINAPRQRPMRLFEQHLERQDIKPEVTKEVGLEGKKIVKYRWNLERYSY